MKALIIATAVIFDILAANPLSADDHLPTGTEIMQKGMILNKQMIDRGGFFTAEYWVIYKDMYFFCTAGNVKLSCTRQKVSKTKEKRQ